MKKLSYQISKTNPKRSITYVFVVICLRTRHQNDDKKNNITIAKGESINGILSF